jgi:hypothetical protein
MLNRMDFELGDVVTAPWCARVRSTRAGHVSNLRCSGVRHFEDVVVDLVRTVNTPPFHGLVHRA